MRNRGFAGWLLGLAVLAPGLAGAGESPVDLVKALQEKNAQTTAFEIEDLVKRLIAQYKESDQALEANLIESAYCRGKAARTTIYDTKQQLLKDAEKFCRETFAKARAGSSLKAEAEKELAAVAEAQAVSDRERITTLEASGTPEDKKLADKLRGSIAASEGERARIHKAQADAARAPFEKEYKEFTQ